MKNVLSERVYTERSRSEGQLKIHQLLKMKLCGTSTFSNAGTAATTSAAPAATRNRKTVAEQRLRLEIILRI